MPKAEVTIQTSTFFIDDFIASSGISRGVLEEVKSAELVMIPMSDFREIGVPLFPNLSEELYAFINRNNPEGTKVSVCIDEENYKELVLHHSVLHVATWVGEKVLLPQLIKWVVDFAKSKWGETAKTEVHFKMILTDEKKEIEYKGPATEMSGVLLEAIKKMTDGNEK